MYSVVRTALPRSSFVAQRALFSSSTLIRAPDRATSSPRGTGIAAVQRHRSSDQSHRQGSATKPLDNRERAAEEAYSRDRASKPYYVFLQENEKLKALKKSIEASKKHLEQLEKDHAELESSQKK
ncbi:BQ5605_C017g08404 [Microbotryum silenes-dioicae]|uniref:BQ5605_C017g08404 protein n=1 Tax=Microbotryum silenes-dioicae TaxID=796604 RepID=A0A2X0LZ86_9BASI|nr:BQ5605_C017g08404 [Microbotryum silenes-dioicae]